MKQMKTMRMDCDHLPGAAGSLGCSAFSVEQFITPPLFLGRPPCWVGWQNGFGAAGKVGDWAGLARARACTAAQGILDSLLSALVHSLSIPSMDRVSEYVSSVPERARFCLRGGGGLRERGRPRPIMDFAPEKNFALRGVIHGFC